MKASVVVDLGFGDAGKGLVTDWLVRREKAPLVVRYNGGAQAGHNVVTADGRHHTFSQFGAGTFAGARTFLGPKVVVHPTALLLEARDLEGKGISKALDRVSISEHARITTPFHQAANRLRERARGSQRHGSVGVGVGETVSDSLLHPDETVCARDLDDPATLRRKLERIRERKRSELVVDIAAPEWEVFERDDVIGSWIDWATHVRSRVVDDERMRTLLREGAGAEIVFEGAQGVLLDERFGFHPHTTWSNCTADDALALLREHDAERAIEIVAVVRTHMVRHGAGPLPTETRELVVREHNHENPWQGSVRYGWFDATLVRYALAAIGGPSPIRLAVTHADVSGPWRASRAWQIGGVEVADLDVAAVRREAEPSDERTALAFRAEPVLVDGSPVETIGSLLERPVDIVATGPTANDVRAR